MSLFVGQFARVDIIPHNHVELVLHVCIHRVVPHLCFLLAHFLAAAVVAVVQIVDFHVGIVLIEVLDASLVRGEACDEVQVGTA